MTECDELIGRQVVHLSQVGSTNDLLRRRAAVGAPEGLVIVADFQSAGRGRLDRRWESPAQSGLLFSVLLRPNVAADESPQVTMLSGLAVVDAVQQQTGLRLGLKWPNDILYGTAKIGGILTELSLAGPRVDYVVVGIGLNVNLVPEFLGTGLLVPASSLSHELGRPVPRQALLRTLLRCLDTRYAAFRKGWHPHGEWVQRLVTLGREVAVHGDGRTLTGLAVGVDEDGALRVQTADGMVHRVLAGDVSLRAIAD